MYFMSMSHIKFYGLLHLDLSSRHERYIIQLRISNVLTPPMYIQLIHIVTLAKLKDAENEHIVFPEIHELSGRSKELFDL